MKVDFWCNTAGDGFWTRVRKPVHCIRLAVDPLNSKFGELRVYFDKSTWINQENGLIYTDGLFEKELCEQLTKLGFDTSDVSYSEQGMQGSDYVSCDVGYKFLSTWNLMP